MRIRFPVALRVCEQLTTPALVGWLRPVILIPPAALCDLPIDYLESLLLHELAHVRRHDYLVNLLQVDLGIPAENVVTFGVSPELNGYKAEQSRALFERAADGGTNLFFSVDFAFKSRLFETLAGSMFDRALRRMTQAFEQRAATLYGISNSSAQSAA